MSTTSREIDASVEELKEAWRFRQQVRSLLLLTHEKGDSFDRKALVILAVYVKNWAALDPPRLTPGAKEFLLSYCADVLDAGSNKDGSPMPKPVYIGAGFELERD